MKTMKILEHLSSEERLRAGTVQAQGDLAMWVNTWEVGWEVQRRRSQALLVVPRDRIKGRGYKVKYRKFHLNFYHCKGDQELVHFSLRGCGISIRGDTQKLSGHIPGQPSVTSYWSRVLDQMTSKDPFQPQPFCKT